MFVSFFPSPKIFFPSCLLWCIVSVGIWYTVGDDWGRALGFQIPFKESGLGYGFAFFFSQKFLWFYLFYVIATSLFYAVWKCWNRHHRWLEWSILGSSLIILLAWFSVQYLVAYNNWLRPFFDTIQHVMSGKRSIEVGEIYGLLSSIFEVFVLGVTAYVLERFVINHYVFRWRTAMNEHYISRWDEIRTVEGASQRIQEDTMKFASIMNSLGVSILDSIMTLFSFFPVMMALSVHVKELPLVGEVPMPLLLAILGWSLFGTILLLTVGIKLPGLEFENQKVEAAYRKELVYGEDNTDRAGLKTLRELYDDVRKNYFRLYFHYAYFDVARISYTYMDYLFALYVMAPTIAAGAISFGIFTQIQMAMGRVGNSFQYLVNSWSTIVEFLSIYKRLAQFEQSMKKG